MTFIQHNNTPSPRFLDQLVDKVNAFGTEPRVIVELDKFVYVPGIKRKFESLELVRDSALSVIGSNDIMNSGSGTIDPSNASGTVKSDDMLKEIIKLKEPVGITPVTSGGNSPGTRTGDRFDYIKCTFEAQRRAYGLHNHAYMLGLAVAQHETDFGTLGQGRPIRGSFIVGYGCPGNCNMVYKGIVTQAQMFMKRYAEALKSRMNAINTRGYLDASDIAYFHDGGDKGRAYTWSADGANWKNRVTQNYNTIRTQIMQMSTVWGCGKIGNLLFTENSGGALSHLNTVPITATDLDDDVYYNDGTTEYYIPPKVNVSTNTIPSTGMLFPLQGYTLTSGAKISSGHFTVNPLRPDHRGIDLVLASGAGKVFGVPIVAVFDGKVTRAEYNNSYGWVVSIEHFNGYGTTYAHMVPDSVKVSKGDIVSAGTVLGKCGSSGNSTGAHLHFEIYKGKWSPIVASTLNPEPYLRGKINISNVTVDGLVTASDTSTPEVIENIVFDKCFSDKDRKLPNKFIDYGSAKYFYTKDTVSGTYVHAFGFTSGSVGAGNVDSIILKHAFSADGYFQPKLYLKLGEGDSVKLRIDGINSKVYTKDDNGIIDVPPLYVKFSTSTTSATGEAGSNEHIFELLVDDESGTAEVGYSCIKLAEIEGGTINNGTVTYRTNIDWVETGDMVFDKTFYLEEKVINWEVNSHFDIVSSTARVTLDNTEGIFSPTYEYSHNFPRNLVDTDMAYYENGERRHVISEGTPVRIYAGYGDDMVRVFTGKITGEIEVDADTNTVTFNCVDMYTLIENYIFPKPKWYPDTSITSINSTTDISKPVVTGWVMSSIIHNIAKESGMVGWRVVEDDWRYPDIIVEESYYIDIDRGGKTAVVWDDKLQQYVTKTIDTVRTLEGFKNPYVMSMQFNQGTRASDAIQQIIGETMYRAYCDRYGTFRLENTRDLFSDIKWEFVDNVNLQSLTTSIDYTRTRNHLMILGSNGNTDHFIDTDLFVAVKGQLRTAQVEVEWLDETNGSNARGVKQELANRLFMDAKRQSRTFNVIVKGNPLIDVTDGCYVYSEDASVNGYYMVKGHTLTGNREGMVSALELTWQIDTVSNQL